MSLVVKHYKLWTDIYDSVVLYYVCARLILGNIDVILIFPVFPHCLDFKSCSIVSTLLMCQVKVTSCTAKFVSVVARAKNHFHKIEDRTVTEH